METPATITASKKMQKLISYWIISRLDEEPVAALNYFVELSIQSRQVKYLDRARDLIDRQMAIAMSKSDHQ